MLKKNISKYSFRVQNNCTPQWSRNKDQTQTVLGIQRQPIKYMCFTNEAMILNSLILLRVDKIKSDLDKIA